MGFRGSAETMSVDGIRRRDYLPELSEEERRAVYYYAIYPNLLLSLHPDYMMIHTIWPEAVDRTKIICEWYFHPRNRPRPTSAWMTRLSFGTQPTARTGPSLSCPKPGFQSRAYTPGPYSKREALLYAFDQIVTNAILLHGDDRDLLERRPALLLIGFAFGGGNCCTVVRVGGAPAKYCA